MKHSIVILGTGNVGHHLALCFAKQGFRVSIWNRTTEHAHYTANISGASLLNSITQIPYETDLCIAAVSENVLVDVVSKLPQIKGILVHTAGSVHMEVLKPYAERYGVLYPLQTFTKNKILNYSKIPIFYETSDDAGSKILCDLIGGIFETIRFLNSEERKQLHLAAVFACNFVNASIMASEEILMQTTVSFSELMPLIRETIDKLEYGSPCECQTGPAIRKNNNTIKQHIAMLEHKPKLKAMYQVITEYITSKFQQ